MFTKRGRREEGVAQLKEPDKLLETAEKLYERGRTMQNAQEIRRLLEKALELQPRLYRAHLILGYIELDLKRYDLMQRHFLRALELNDDPMNVFTWDNVIVSLDDGLRDYQRLAEYLENFYKKCKNKAVVEYLVRTYFKLNQKEKALNLLTNFLALYPDNKSLIRLRTKLERSIHPQRF